MLPLSSTNEVEQSEPRGRRLTPGVRIALVLVLAGLGLVFTIAAGGLTLRDRDDEDERRVIVPGINPYDGEGKPKEMETHRQLGLPACSFKVMTRSPTRPDGLPCPSCGMTTSFALLAHGDVKNSLRANYVGTLLAVFCVVLIPWGVLSLVRGRLLGVRSLERSLTWFVAIFLTLLLVRWAIVLARWTPS